MTCDSHQSAGERTRWPRNGARLQAAQFRGTGLPQPRDRESGDQTFLPPHGTSGSCPLHPVCSRLLREEADAPETEGPGCSTTKMRHPPSSRQRAVDGRRGRGRHEKTPDGEPGNLTATVTGSTNEDSGAAAARSARRRRKRQTYLSNATEPTSSICSSMVKRQMPMWPLRKSPFASQSMLPETPW